MVSLQTTVCVVGGGPAGLMAGLLLARSGVGVIVLEKHKDFLRDFRGDTVHPSTLEVLHDLGLLDRFFLKPHQKVRRLSARFGHQTLIVGDFTGLRVPHPYIAMIPQWDFLDLIASEARSYPSFRLIMRAEVKELIEKEGRVVGVRAEGENGEFIVSSDLVIGADGRHSIVRREARLPLDEQGAPMDVLWMRISRLPSDPAQPFISMSGGQALVMINRERYFQCGFLIEKGSYESVRSEGLPRFRRRVAEMAGFLGDRVEELKTWDDIKLLRVSVNLLRQWWRPGLLCIGDAAHAMSPVGGIGVNLAIQDAVAAANILVKPLRSGGLHVSHLEAVQNRRLWPTKMAQRFQVWVQRRVIREALRQEQREEALRPPWFLRLVDRSHFLRRLVAYGIGFGARPERIKTRFEPLCPLNRASRPASVDLQ